MKLSVHLVTWNGAKYIPSLFESLRQQTFKDWKLCIWDNNSSDDTVAEIKKELENFPFEYKIIEHKENIGFAGGHKQLYDICGAEYFLIINQDLYLNNDCMEKMIKFVSEHNDVSALAPSTMKWDFAENKFTNVVDSLGLKVYRNRRVVEIGEGEEYHEKNKEFDYVFGLSGAIILFRKKVIDEIGFLDESFESYKEDVDLAFRLNSFGAKAAILYSAVAYHDRSGGGFKHKDDISSVKNKFAQKPWVRYHSYKNHIMTIYKNEYWQNLTIDFFAIIWYELKKLGYFILFDMAVLKGLGVIWDHRKELKTKRKEITSKRKLTWREMRSRMN